MAVASSSFTTPTLSSISSAVVGLVTIGAAHGWEVGDVLSFQGLTEMTELNGHRRTIITVPSSTTCTVGDTSAFTAESTGGADTCNLAIDRGGYLHTGRKGENVTVALSGTYSNAIHLERALNPDLAIWEKIAPVDAWQTDNATISFVYETVKDDEVLRLVSTAATPTGTVTATLTDAAKIIKTFFDDDGNEIFRLTEDGVTFTLPITQDAIQAYTLAHTHSGAETHSGTETHSGIEIHSGNEIHTGNESHSGIETHSGAETHSGLETTSSQVGTSAATSVLEYGESYGHTTVLTCTALVQPAITEGANTAVGDLIYTFPVGAIILEWVYFNLSLDLDGTDQDAITAEIGLGQTIATGAVARLASTPGFEDICQARDVLCDGVATVVQARVPTNGGPMFIASGDVRTVHVNIANGAAVWAAQSDGDGTSTYTGIVILRWSFLE